MCAWMFLPGFVNPDYCPSEFEIMVDKQDKVCAQLLRGGKTGFFIRGPLTTKDVFFVP